MTLQKAIEVWSSLAGREKHFSKLLQASPRQRKVILVGVALLLGAATACENRQFARPVLQDDFGAPDPSALLPGLGVFGLPPTARGKLPRPFPRWPRKNTAKQV